MPLTTEEQLLLIRVQGTVELEKLNAALAAEQAAMLATVKAGAAAAGGQTAFDAAFSRSAAVIKQVKDDITKVPASIEGAESKIRGMNSALRGLGYGISDIFSNNCPIGQKMQGFGNNITGITTGILQSMGRVGPQAILLAAGLEIGFDGIAAAMNAFGIKTIDDIKRVITGGVKEMEHGVEGLKARIKGLEDKPVKIAVDVLELDTARKDLDDLQKKLAAFRTFEEARSKRQKESAAAVQTVVEESKVPGVDKKLKEQAAQELEKTDSGVVNARKEQAEFEAKAGQVEGAVERIKVAAKAYQAAWLEMGQKGQTPDRMAAAQAARAELDAAKADPHAITSGQGSAADLRAGAEIRRQKVIDEAARIRETGGAAEQRVGGAREAAAKGDVGPLIAQMKGINEGGLARKLAETTPEALKQKEQQERADVVGQGGARDTIKEAIDGLMKPLKDAAAARVAAARNRAAEIANRERARGIPEGKIEVEPLTPPSRPKPVTVPQKRARAMDEAIRRKRLAKAAKADATARRRAAMGQQAPGRMTPPRGFRSGVPTGVKRPPTLERPPVPAGPMAIGGTQGGAQGDGLGQVAQGVQGVNGASLARDRAAQGAAGEMLQAMNALATAHAQNGQGWGQIAAAAKQIRNGIKRPGA